MEPTETKSHKTQAEQGIHFRRLTSFQKDTKLVLGITLFCLWLLFFILGISLNAEHFHPYIIPADTICWNYLILYAVSLTPINVSILASLAGALGGIASNLAANNKFSLIRPPLHNQNSTDFQSYLYMTESPLVSLLRGFTTFMIFIAGSYLTNFTTSGNPANSGEFTGLTVSTYTRFAVTVSLLSYLAGYDPSRIKSLLSNFNLGKNNHDQFLVKTETVDKQVTHTEAIGKVS